MSRRHTTEEFIIKAQKIHDSKYNYSYVKYEGSYIKIFIGCKKHGKFQTTPASHLKGTGCPNCGVISRTKKSIKNTDWFIIKANEKHNKKYDYSRVNYIKYFTKIKIICKKHGEFEQTPASHMTGSGCPKCANKNVTTEEFINKAKKFMEMNMIIQK